jgi:hypothetical protein
MIGDLLFASRSITFNYNRAAGMINVANPGSTSIVNSIIAEDNSPVPADRVSFRYNHFDDVQAVTGFGPPVFDAHGVGTSFPETRHYDLDRYTFIFEKAFLDERLSVELRVPFSTTLSSTLDLRAGTVTGPVAGAPDTFGVRDTPGDTLGRDGTQSENIDLIFKGLLLRRERLAVSGGLGVEVPTAADTHVGVTDFSGRVSQGVATVERFRDFRIDNETWALSPFVALLATPGPRFFAQGFLEFDFPLNPSTINYSDTFVRGRGFAIPPQFSGGVPTLVPPFAVRSGISEQSLMHVDLGTGWWLLRDSSRTCLTGIAPTLELHYTTTLQDASVVSLPGDGLFRIDPTGRRVTLEPGPQIGNQRNRLDILDMTVGTTFVFSDRATLATGVAFPLRGSDNRTFDWEFHLQLNYYFGAPRFRSAPNL